VPTVTILRHIALCAAGGLFFAVAPPIGIAVLALVAWKLPRDERAEFLCLFGLVVVFPTLGLLSWIVLNRWGGPVFFLSLALLRDFFSWFRPDPNSGWSDTGPALTTGEWHVVMYSAFCIGVACAVAYPVLLNRRFRRTGLPN
jgi:hypothetical protein